MLHARTLILILLATLGCAAGQERVRHAEVRPAASPELRRGSPIPDAARRVLALAGSRARAAMHGGVLRRGENPTRHGPPGPELLRRIHSTLPASRADHPHRPRRLLPAALARRLAAARDGTLSARSTGLPPPRPS